MKNLRQGSKHGPRRKWRALRAAGGCALLGCALIYCGVPARAQSATAPVRYSANDSNVADPPLRHGLAERRLGQGVSYFYEGRYALASKLIREALALKLAHPADEAIAHQYMAFFYCLHDRPDQCEQEFRLAMSGPTPIELSAAERDNPAWRAIYARLRAELPSLPGDNVVRGRFGGKIEQLREHEPNPNLAAHTISLGKVNDRSAARLQLAVAPWGDVYINQQKVAVSPPVREINMSPGTYTIEVRNAELPAFVQTVALKARTAYRLSYHFEPNR